MQKFPQDIECIIPPSNGAGGIYISNLEAASNLHTLARYNIQAVITACRGYILKHTPEQLPYYLYLPADDHQSFNISKFFQEAIEFISHKLRKTNVLVHCMAGISRSVTLVLAYLVRNHGHSVQTAFQLVKTRRNKIHPNIGFIKQLRIFEESHRGKENSHLGSLLMSESKAMTKCLNPVNSSYSSSGSGSRVKKDLDSSQVDNLSKQLTRTLSNLSIKKDDYKKDDYMQKRVDIKDYDRRLKESIRSLKVQNTRLSGSLKQDQWSRISGDRRSLIGIKHQY